MKKLMIAALPAITALAACSSSHTSRPDPGTGIGSNTPAPSAGSAAPNPVDTLRRTGAELPAGANVPTDRGNGEKQAVGLYFATAKDRAAGTGERITVTSYPSNAERTASGDVPDASDDAHWYITVDRALVTVTGVEDAASHSVVFALPAQTIAGRIGGHLIPRG